MAEDIDRHTSRWEYSKSTSRYHFDKTLDEDRNPPFKKIGWFTGMDFKPLVDYCLKLNIPSTLLNRLGADNTPYTASADANDLEALGYGRDWVLYQRTEREMFFAKSWPMSVQKMVSFFGMAKVNVAIHTQLPGQCFPVHIDNLTTLRDNKEDHVVRRNPDLAARFTVQLLDWEWGHVFGFGNTYWKQWRAGEIAHHSWADIPHYTANAGHSPRVTLQISGLVTDATRRILAAEQPMTIDLAASP